MSNITITETIDSTDINLDGKKISLTEFQALMVKHWLLTTIEGATCCGLNAQDMCIENVEISYNENTEDIELSNQHSGAKIKMSYSEACDLHEVLEANLENKGFLKN